MFGDKSARVMVIDQSGAVRQLLTEVVRKQGFSSIRGVPSIKDALAVLEVEAVDWILSPLFKDGEVNGLQLLALINSRPILRGTRVSLLLDAEEQELVLAAYEQGMLSHFLKPLNKDVLAKALADFLNLVASCQEHPCRIAAACLRDHLIKNELYKAQLQLEKGLLKVFPGDLEFLLNMAEPYYQLGMRDKAKAILKQVMLIDPEWESKVMQRGQKIFGDDHSAQLKELSLSEGSFNSLGLKNCVVVDPDDACRKLIVDALKSLGVENILDFEDGESAWTWLHANKAIDLFLHEWRIPKLTGPLLLQRIRKKFPCAPIISVSSLINDDDKPLVQEMGVTAVVRKPLDKQDLIKTIVYVVQEDRLPSKDQDLAEKIKRLLEANQYDEAVQLKAKFSENAEISLTQKQKIDAEFAYAEGNFLLARDLAVEVIKSQSDSITMLNFIGKCLMQLKDYAAALKCFQKAQKMSPMNIQRLCAIAEASQELGNNQAANEALNQAKSLDKDNERIVETETGISLSQGDVGKAKAIMEGLSSIANVVSYLNNKAVACSRCGLFDEGTEFYKKIFLSIPDNRKDIRAIVTYNLALAYARMDKLEEALEQLKMVKELGKSKVYSKSKSLYAKIEKAKVFGDRLVLNAGANDKAPLSPSGNENEHNSASSENQHERESEHASTVGTVEATPGELCCFRVFVNPEPACELAVKLLATLPRFKPREALARDEAAGLEKSLKK